MFFLGTMASALKIYIHALKYYGISDIYCALGIYQICPRMKVLQTSFVCATAATFYKSRMTGLVPQRARQRSLCGIQVCCTHKL